MSNVITTEDNGIKKEVSFGTLTVSRVYVSDYQKKNTLTAELKQVVTTKTTYPAAQLSNSLESNLFATADFDLGHGDIYESTETRVAWVNVPLGSTVETVTTKLASIEGAKLYKIMSNQPILSDNDERAIASDQLNVTLDGYANRQAVRYPLDHESSGELALDSNNKVQYRRIAFTTNPSQKDVDYRDSDPANTYLSEMISIELAEGVMPEQSIS